MAVPPTLSSLRGEVVGCDGQREDRGPAMPCLRTLWLQVHATLELFALMVVVFELCMKLRWLGLHTFVRHKRTMVKVACPSPMAFSPLPPSICLFTSTSPAAQKCNPGPHPLCAPASQSRAPRSQSWSC